MKQQPLHDLPSYTITSEEFLLDYMPLPDEQKIVLFKLRMGYVMKGSGLTADDIEGFCPAITDQQKTARQKVLARFFHRENDQWIDDRIQSAIDEINAEKTHQKTIRDKRSTAGKISAQVRLSADKNKIVDTPTNQQNFNNCSTDVGTNDQRVLEQNMNKCSTSVGTYVGTSVQQVLKQNQKFDNNSLKYQENEISENRSESTDSDSLAYTRTHARASDPINNINLLNKKIIGSDARTRTYAHTREENREKIKEFFEEVSATKTWSTEQLMELLVYSGLNHSALDSWIGRSAFNHDKFNQLASSMKLMGSGDFFNVVSRCKAAKQKENREFKTSVAFVIKALEKEIVLIQEHSKPPDPPVTTSMFRDKVYSKAGLVQLANGSYRVLPRSQR